MSYVCVCSCVPRQELAGECGSQALNPNELGAVLKVLSLLAAELEVDAAGELSTVRTCVCVLGTHPNSSQLARPVF